MEAPVLSMSELLADHLRCVSPDCNLRDICYHYTRPNEDGLIGIMPLNTGIDCPDFDPVEED